MKILILGYGKMGKAIEEIAVSRGHEIKYKIDEHNYRLLEQIKKGDVDVAVEFTQPESAFSNLKFCIDREIPVVCGTTGWLERRNELEDYCLKNNGTFFHSSNYSIGVNLFFYISEKVARLMNDFPEYEVTLEEIHHIHKKDAPSGTAITIAEGVLKNIKRKSSWVNEATANDKELTIISKREDAVPGTHSVLYKSRIDSIELKHTAFSREGFAFGAVLVSEWIYRKKGVFTMNDFLNFENK